MGFAIALSRVEFYDPFAERLTQYTKQKRNKKDNGLLDAIGESR